MKRAVLACIAVFLAACGVGFLTGYLVKGGPKTPAAPDAVEQVPEEAEGGGESAAVEEEEEEEEEEEGFLPAPVPRKVVCLDPGHADTPSSIDPVTGLNTRDWANEPEIRIVYDIAVRAAALLKARGVEVVMTKQSAYDPVNLMQRAITANEAGAALILHIHTDSGISLPTTFYPGGDADHNWKANSESGRKAVIDPDVQVASQRLAGVFHAAMTSTLGDLTGVPGGGLQVENRGATGTGNYGPIFSYDIWSEVPTFTIENNQGFADTHRQEVAQAIADGIMACLD